jgi:transcriptional regulator with XRE-family HTH domain
VDGSRIRERRRKLNLRLQALAEGVGRAPSFISELERGRIKGTPTDFARIDAFLRPREALLARAVKVQDAEPRRVHGATR